MQEPGAADEKRGGMLDRRQAVDRVAAGKIDVHHAAIDAVVGGVMPDHRLVCGGDALVGIDLFVVVRPRLAAFTGAVTGRDGLDDLQHAAGVGLDQFQKTAHTTAARR